jgi:hypothetical protein
MINGNKIKVHRIVAKYFCEGYFDGAVVNHKDCNKLNNNADNLEWCTSSYNTRHAYANNCYKTHRVVLCDKENRTIQKFNTIKEASLVLGKNKHTIRKHLTGKKKNFADGEYDILVL